MRALAGILIIIPHLTSVVNCFLPFRYTIFQHHKALTISIFSLISAARTQDIVDFLKKVLDKAGEG
jgi:hypothetical protein